MYGLPTAGAGTAEAKVCWMVSLGREDVCVASLAKETCGAHEAKFAVFSRVSSRVSMFCKVMARDFKVFVRMLPRAAVGAEAQDRVDVLLIFSAGALDEAAFLVLLIVSWVGTGTGLERSTVC